MSRSSKPAPATPNSVGYQAIREAIGAVQHLRGASSTPTEFHSDLPPRFESELRKLRLVIEMHAALTERTETEMMHALRSARAAEAAATECQGAVLVVPNLAQDLASQEARLERLERGTSRSIRSLSRWWTAIAVLGVANVVLSGVLVAAIASLVVSR